MKAPDRVAFLTAVMAGAKAELDKAKADVLALGDEVESDKFRSQFGPVVIAHPDPKPVITDPAAFLAWVKTHHPDEVTETVRPAYASAYLSGLVVDDGVAVDPGTGEQPEWVGVTSPEPYVTYPASAPQKAVKAQAVEWFGDRADRVLDAIRHLDAIEPERASA